MAKLIFRVLLMLLLVPGILYAEEVLVLANESMPFNGIVDGKNAGMTYEILEEATKHGAPDFKYRFGLPWIRAQKMILAAGSKPMAIVPFTRTPKREESHIWIAELFMCPVRLSTYKRPPVTLDEARHMTVGMLSGSANITFFKSMGIERFDFGKNAIINAKKLASGRFEVLGEAKYVDVYAWKQAGFDARNLNFTELPDPRYVYIAGNINFPPELALKIRSAIDKMKANGKLDAILEKWK